jgi:hypothetical protein
MNPIYVLWATPRSTSTAFEWMMRMRGDMACFHEPFGEAWYRGDDSIWHESLKNSDGLKAQSHQHVDVLNLPPRLHGLYHDFLPHYQKLHAHRLRP